jgi:serine/threonine protein kinase/ABC-type Fe3+-hydroxamate transport system substrate-binding protein
MALSVGTVFAGYTIEAVAGSGGMGTVYRAAHPRLPRSDALKILSEEYSRDEQIRRRFLREADVAIKLDHPNIVTVYDRGETDDGRLWIAMQYVAGSDADKEARDGQMSPSRAIHIIDEVAAALDYAHRRHILHRDVKPANFLLAANDDNDEANDERVFLADFGIARALDEAAAGLTQTGFVMASIAFTAPESIKATGVDHRADIYSLGCSLYNLLTGKTPFSRSGAGGMAGVAAAHLFEPPPRVTEYVPTLPVALDAVVAKAMAKEPDGRYQSARELADAATQALTGVVPAPTPQPQDWFRPPPSTAAAATPADEVTVELSYPSGFFSGPDATAAPSRPQPLTSPAEPTRRRLPSRRAVIIGAAALIVVILAAVTALVLRGPDEPRDQAQTLVHVHGSTEVAVLPRAVAALGPGDADAVLSLGVQPVALTAPNGRLPSWEQSALSGSPPVLSAIDTAAVAAAHPDLIIATGDIDDATYGKLAAIAPTITRPTDAANQGWNWQNQLTWIGRILGQQPKAEELIRSVRSLQGDLSNQNPGAHGKSVEAVRVSDTGVAEVLTPSFAADYLESLGFRYNPDLARNPVDIGTTRPVADLARIYQIETDVMVVIRTDSEAGRGGFAGLPKPFATYAGRMVIVDEPNAVAAFDDPGGYLATKYLDDNLVSRLSTP